MLVCLAQHPAIRGRDIAARVGMTERAAQAIIADLVRAGYVQRTGVGRRNRYEVNPHLSARHPVEQPHRVGELLAALASRDEESGSVRQTSVGRGREDLSVDGERRRSPSAD